MSDQGLDTIAKLFASHLRGEVVPAMRETLDRVVAEIISGGESANLGGVVRALPSPRLLTAEQVGERCSVTPPTVRAWIHSGKLIAKRAGHRWLVASEDLEKFLAARASAPAASVDVQKGVSEVMARLARMSR